ncbi:MAG: Ig-like domain-containing protein, partial [Candidatus Omnitrophota bacterium]
LARQMEALLKEGANKEELDKLNNKFKALAKMQKASIMSKELSSLKEKIEKLGKISPQAADELKEQLKNMQSNPSEQELKKVMDKMEEGGLSMQVEEKKPKQPAQDGNSPWQIYILPSQLVLGSGSTATLKAIAVYNKSFIKELISELEWSSSNPKAVEIDYKGTISAFSEGRSKITAIYKGRVSSPAQVIVVGKTAPETEGAVKKELTVN